MGQTPRPATINARRVYDAIIRRMEWYLNDVGE
jgi:hypothetical protein